MNDIESPTEAYVNALVGIGGQLTSTIHHMLTYSDQRNPPIAEVLTRLLTDIVDAELDEAPDDLYTAAGIPQLNRHGDRGEPLPRSSRGNLTAPSRGPSPPPLTLGGARADSLPP